MTYDDWLTREPDRFDPGRLDDDGEPDAVDTCDVCGSTCGMGWVTVAGVGIYCSPICARAQQAERRAAS